MVQFVTLTILSDRKFSDTIRSTVSTGMFLGKLFCWFSFIVIDLFQILMYLSWCFRQRMIQFARSIQCQWTIYSRTLTALWLSSNTVDTVISSQGCLDRKNHTG